LIQWGDPSDQEIATMKKHTSLALAAGLLLAGASAASAAPNLKLTAPIVHSPATSAVHSSANEMAPPAKDTLSLTSKQQKSAWNDLYVKSLNQQKPAGFHVATGAALPKSIATGQMTTKAAGDVPALKPYDFAQLDQKLVIVNPRDRKIAEVITR
jgi:hypothetical protein